MSDVGRIDVMCDEGVRIADDPSHGYTQGEGRMGPVDFDCAGLAIWCARKAGYDTRWASYTGDMVPALEEGGWTVLPYSRAALRRGDLEIRPKTSYQTGHVAICIGPGRIVEAYSNEFGGIVGGQSGDQTGREIRVAADWCFGTHILRPPADPAPKPEPTPIAKKGPDEEVPMPIRQGDVRRLYNPNNGDHVYTTDPTEVAALLKAGMEDEGTLGVAPEGYGVLYRFANADTGQHLWTDDYVEAKDLLRRGENLSDGTRHGWQYEGEAMVVHEGDQGAVKMHRLYREGAPHLLTADRNEIDSLVADGWKDEGVKFSLDAK